jgi:cyclic beta-1,2-glucan synthetase
MIPSLSQLTRRVTSLFSLLMTRPMEDPIRSELFSLERFDQHAQSLAVAQTITDDPKAGAPLTPRLRENEKILQTSYRYLTSEVQKNKTINPAGEWLIDSFYVVEEQLRDIKRYLPDDFYNELPKLSEGHLKGYPRVYGLAWAYVAHTDSRFDAESLSNFVRSYQQVQPLTIGELWALAITLRVVMIDNLRRIALYLVTSQEAHQNADAFVDELLGLIEESSEKTRPSAAKLKQQSAHPAFLVQLIQRLRYQDPKGIPAVNWLNDRLAEKKTTAEEMVTSVHSRQSANNQTVRNIITSFRTMNLFDWQEFFEKVSPVQAILCEHLDFKKMDFMTRNSYRSAVEELAKGSKKSEMEIARLVIQKTLESTELSERLQDPGYYLLAEGRRAFEKTIGFRVLVKNRFVRFCTDHPASTYIGYVFVLTSLILAIAAALNVGLSTPLLLLLLAVGLFPASDLAVSRVNRFITQLIPPRHLSRLEFLDGPPAGFKTFVVVPTLLGSEEEIPEQLEKLEVHYLSNSEGEVRFALLTDWPDSTVEISPEDLQLMALTEQLVAALNQKHGPASDGGSRFFFFHRKRLWNPLEDKWMGWERKRGKLHEFNLLLRGSKETSYFNNENPSLTIPEGIRYVITLDADTKLPPGVVSQLVGILAHPLHRARLDPQSHKVVEGYGILQPRVTSFLPNQNEKSIFQKLFSGECGIDPYASAVSDVYQDLFGEGSFTGKGIYDLDAYETALKGRIPENSLLSHDLFEGSFARCGYASDLEFFEDFPSHAEISTVRNHRWIRGDWQLLPWLFGRDKANLSTLSQWKMLDNLRRSLSPIAAVGLLLAVFCAPVAKPAVWVTLVLFSVALPSLLPFLESLAFWRGHLHWRDQLSEIKRYLLLGGGQFIVNLVLIANRAWIHLDAVTRTLWRLWITHKNLLEWVTAAQARSVSSLTHRSFWRRMKGSVSIGLLALILTALFNPKALPVCLPLALAWLGAPWFARRISLPESKNKTIPLTVSETEDFRLYGRRVWRFFKTFAESEDHFLPPDNFQEDPEPAVAHRSSPTNFGLHLLSVVTARDFGWCGLADMTDYLEAALKSLKDLRRHRGHFFNWYDTQTLQVLEPQYISSVDSGNLAGHLLTLSQACLDLTHQPVFSPSVLSGVRDSLTLFKRFALELPDHGRTAGTPFSQFQKEITHLEEKLNEINPGSLAFAAAHWEELELQAETMKDTAHAFASDQRGAETGEMTGWADRVAEDIKSHGKDFKQFFSWFACFDSLLLAAETEEEKEIQLYLQRLLSSEMPLSESPFRCEKAIELFESLRQLRLKRGNSSVNEIAFDQIREALTLSANNGREMLRRLNSLADISRGLFNEMDFSFLLNPRKKLFSVGYRVAEDQLDESCYDLLASESRLTSYVAIIKGDVPVSHWFRLGRGLVADEGEAMLISWSGSMFEYLMPSLVMTTPDGSLLDQTCQRVVERQIQYGNLRGVPWGISEAGYNVRDLNLAYQYSNFGVPGLGLKRGLLKDLVIAPYATALAAMVDPQKALLNLKRIEKLGACGVFGFYEALDYTPSRVRENDKFALVRSYMAHHQGMSLLAFSNVVHDGLLRRRFLMDPLVQAGELLLQERTPRNLGAARDQMKEVEVRQVHETILSTLRKIRSPRHPIPSTHLLSNGRYAVMITAAGSGYSLWKNRAVTRWREDVTKDHYGNYLFLRDIQSDQVWSAAYHPTLVEPLQYEANFSEDRAKISRLDYSIFTDLEVIVSAEDDAELRQLTLTNLGTEMREIEITSYAEVVLAPADADLAHPAFSNLFIETGFLPALSALTAARRPRSSTDEKVFTAQVLSSEGETFGGVEYETDRSRFIGRGRNLRNPISVTHGRSLSNTVGAVLDPVMSLRVKVRLQPGAVAKVCFTTLAAGSEAEMLAMAEKYHNSSSFERSSNLVWTQSKAKLYHLGIDLEEAELFQKLANRIIFSDPLMRPTSEILKKNRMNVTGLWSRGISGDLPIVLVRIDDIEDQSLIRQLLRAHEYWRMKRLSVDIVILNEKATSYVQDLQISLEALARGSEATSAGNPDLPPGKIFVLRSDLLDIREKELLLTVARAILHNRQGTMAEQVMRIRKSDNFKSIPAKRLDEMESFRLQERLEAPLAVPQLEFFNGIGGFANDGKDYVIVLEKGQRTPAPWINVIANPDFGFLVSESGAGYTWALNSRENQITGWSNDPVVDPVSEAFFISDMDSDQIWSPTASPIRLENATYMARHGAGYSVFENGSNEIHSELTQWVDQSDPIKISKLVLENLSNKPRRLLVTAYVEWVLGFSRVKTAPFIVTERDEETGALFANNPLDIPFGNRVSFLGVNANQISWTSDRSEFIGRNGTLERPAALLRKEKLSGSTGAGLDPCGVLQLQIEIYPGTKKEISFFLGQAENQENARRLVQKYRRTDLKTNLQTVVQKWDQLLGKTRVQTPDRSMDILLNRWLLYQTLSCRFWARTAFYQAGGAFGFRDQLQDLLAIMTTDPSIARAHILKTAARQFLEGDTQHWWHPFTGRGVRTRISDDRLWLPYVVLQYLKVTDDETILDELVPFLEGPPLRPDQEDSYYDPAVSREPPLSLYEHCVRAINVSLKTGAHDLPLMGSGDWNDGMNRVGHDGKGESIWLGWFLLEVLTEMAPLAGSRGDTQWQATWIDHTLELKAALETQGWDGEWYKRAYFDDGAPLGSKENTECQIDSIAQTWAVISGAGDPQRSLQAMQAVENRLIKTKDSMILLFTPPFNKTDKDPGYIKGYLPGVRENGGQYTHAAIWCVCATAKLGMGTRAAELFAMLNPINHALTRTNVGIYKSEPYVMAADIYSQAPHVGRGGWTWYTGSSGWMYRAGTEFILGINQRGSSLHFDPCIPKEWLGFKVFYRHGQTHYEIQFENPNHVSKGIQRIELDGHEVLSTNATIELKDDQQKHWVKVIML